MGNEPSDDKPTDANYDTVVLGTSPVLLIEAVLRARAGERVAVVRGEDHGRMGGAWSTIELDEITEIESACHLMENYRGAYRFLEKVLGLPMEKCEPAPRVLEPDGRESLYCSRWRNGRRLLRVLVRLPIVGMMRIVEAIAGGRFRLRRTAAFCFREAIPKMRWLLRHPFGFGNDRVAIRYPVGGAPRMLNQLTDELRGRGAEFLAARVGRLHIDSGDGVKAELADGKSITSRRVVVCESTTLDSVTTDRGVTRFDRRVRTYPHLIVEVVGLRGRECSYAHLHEDPFVARVSDVTPYCGHFAGDDGARILVIQLRDRPETDDADLVTRALSHVVARGVLSRSVRPRRFRFVQLEFDESVPSAARSLKRRRDPRVIVLRSVGDLSRAILSNRKRWLDLARIGSDAVGPQAHPREDTPQDNQPDNQPDNQLGGLLVSEQTVPR